MSSYGPHFAILRRSYCLTASTCGAKAELGLSRERWHSHMVRVGVRDGSPVRRGSISVHR